MPQMLPMWWVLIFFLTIFMFVSLMSIIYSFIIIPPLKGELEKVHLSSWWKK